MTLKDRLNKLQRASHTTQQRINNLQQRMHYSMIDDDSIDYDDCYIIHLVNNEPTISHCRECKPHFYSIVHASYDDADDYIYCLGQDLLEWLEYTNNYIEC